MIQQLGNTRTDKQLRKSDIANITYASCLNFFYTTSMFNPWTLGLFFVIDYHWVKRINSDSYQFQQAWGSTQYGVSPADMSVGIMEVYTKTKNQIAAYHPDLVCTKDGEERLFMRVCYRKAPGFIKSKIGMFILDISPKRSTYDNYFKHELVITPKPGLFPVKK